MLNKQAQHRIRNLYITIGDLSSIIDDSIQFYWDIISKDTIAEGAHLQFTRIPIQMHCQVCEYDYQPEDGISTCPLCDGAQVKVVAGQEFFLDSIDVDR